MLVHSELEPFKVHVREEFLFDMDPAHIGHYRRMTVYDVASYAGHVPTFSCIDADGSVFSYLPPSAILFNTESADNLDLVDLLDLADLVYHNCPSIHISVVKYRILDHPLSAYFRTRKVWLAGFYKFTMDWYDGNDLLHCIELETGQCAFLPSHKIKFNNGSREFEPFKKLHQTWSV